MGERYLEGLQLLDCKMNVLASCSFGHLVHIVPVCYFILKPTFTCELKNRGEGCNKDRKYMGSVCTVREELLSAPQTVRFNLILFNFRYTIERMPDAYGGNICSL